MAAPQGFCINKAPKLRSLQESIHTFKLSHQHRNPKQPFMGGPDLEISQNQQLAYLSKLVSEDSIAERDVSVMCSTSESLSRIPVFLHGTL